MNNTNKPMDAQIGGGSEIKAVSLPNKPMASVPFKTHTGGTLFPGGGGKKPDKRFETAKALVDAGVTPTMAMRKAGYTESTSRASSGKSTVKQALIKMRDSYLMAYVKQIKKAGLDGKSVADRLGKVVHGKDDYNAVHAIKAHTMILLKNTPSQDEGGINLGIFIAPGSQVNQNWETDAGNLKSIQVSKVLGEQEAA